MALCTVCCTKQVTDEDMPPAQRDKLEDVRAHYDEATSPAWFRSRAELQDLFGGWPLQPPGITWTAQWHDDTDDAEVDVDTEVDADPARSRILAGVAVKPH
ncbi:MAG: SAM-dependent methyltransferase [Sciscionella sp.]